MIAAGDLNKSEPQPRWQLAVFSLFQNEAPYLREWIEFHKLAGVEHFFLYNHDSRDNYLEILQPYIDSGEVDLVDWHWDLPFSPPEGRSKLDQWMEMHCGAIDNALRRASNVARWLALIDSDEFLVPVVADNLLSILKDYESFGGLAVNWQLFGTSGVADLKPGELLIEKLLNKFPWDAIQNQSVKPIVRPELVIRSVSSHQVIFKPGNFLVDSDGQRLVRDDMNFPVKIDKIRINHYSYRTTKFLNEVKIPRRKLFTDDEDAFFGRYPVSRAEYDLLVMRFVPGLKNKLARDPHLPDDFDWVYYITRYDDLRQAGINNREKAISHWLTYGYRENRRYQEPWPLKKKYVRLPGRQYPYYLSLCALVKNEAENLLEWLEFHRLVGVEHFYIYDNCSTDGTRKILKPYIKNGLVDYVYWPKNDGRQQFQTYEDCLTRREEESFWIGFIDLDEFIVPESGSTISELLKSYELANGLGINWVTYNDSGHQTRPPGLVTENFVYRRPKTFDPNLHYKLIVNPRKVKKVVIPHIFLFLDNSFVLDEDGQLIDSLPLSRRHKSARIRVNHYFPKSRAEFEKKIIRGRADGGGAYNWFQFVSRAADDELDPVMDRFLPELKNRLSVLSITGQPPRSEPRKTIFPGRDKKLAGQQPPEYFEKIIIVGSRNNPAGGVGHFDNFRELASRLEKTGFKIIYADQPDIQYLSDWPGSCRILINLWEEENYYLSLLPAGALSICLAHLDFLNEYQDIRTPVYRMAAAGAVYLAVFKDLDRRLDINNILEQIKKIESDYFQGNISGRTFYENGPENTRIFHSLRAAGVPDFDNFWRSIPADFDWEYYLDKNPQLRSHGITTQALAEQHWVNFGQAENRIYKQMIYQPPWLGNTGPEEHRKFRYYLTACAFVKNEGSYLREWIEYHRLQGVEHFYIYDNKSTDQTSQILESYRREGVLDYKIWPESPGQVTAFLDCLINHRLDSFWMAFIDLDEFIVPTGRTSLVELLKTYEGSNGLGINQLIYGNSGRLKKIPGLQTETFVYCGRKDHPNHLVMKSVVNPRRVEKIINSHRFQFLDGASVLDENLNPIDAFPRTAEHNSQKIRINHYYTRSREDFAAKIDRGRATSRALINWQFYQAFNLNNEYDPAVFRYLPELKRRLAQVEKNWKNPAGNKLRRPQFNWFWSEEKLSRASRGIRQAVKKLTKRINIKSALALGAVHNSFQVLDIMDIDPETPGVAINWDVRRCPWPIPNQHYDLFLGLDIINVPGLEDDPALIFNEIQRVARVAILSFPVNSFLARTDKFRIVDKITAGDRIVCLVSFEPPPNPDRRDDFDWRTYLKRYPNLKKKGVVSEALARQHWKKHGLSEKFRGGRPEKFFILGLPKTGTSALFYKIYNSLPKDGCRIFFEPKQLAPAAGVTGYDVLVKETFSLAVTRHREFYKDFDRKLLLVRDPRDWLISRILYSIYDYFYNDEVRNKIWFSLLEKKEKDPAAVSLRELMELMYVFRGEAAGDNMYFDFVSGPLEQFREFHQNFCPDFLLVRYEDLIDGRLAELEKYLGFNLSGSARVDKIFSRVERTKSYGNWKDWFTPEDVKIFRPLLENFMEHYGYGDDWRLRERPKIPHRHCLAYVRRISREKNESEKILPLKLILTGQEGAGQTLVSRVLERIPEVEAVFTGGLLKGEKPSDIVKNSAATSGLKEKYNFNDQDLAYLSRAGSWRELFIRLRARIKAPAGKNVKIIDRAAEYLPDLARVLEKYPVNCLVLTRDPRSLLAGCFRRSGLPLEAWLENEYEKVLGRWLAGAAGLARALADDECWPLIMTLQYEALLAKPLEEFQKIFYFISSDIFPSFRSALENRGVYGLEFPAGGETDFHEYFSEELCQKILERTAEFKNWHWNR